MSFPPKWLDTFPTHNASVASALLLLLVTGFIIAGRLVLGLAFPDGYTPWIAALLALAGITTAGGIGKRATDINLALAKRGIVATPPATAAPEPAPKTDGSA